MAEKAEEKDETTRDPDPHYTGDDFDPALHLMARRFIESECSCGSHATHPEKHPEQCRYRQNASRYVLHARDRQKDVHAQRAYAAVLARTKKKAEAEAAARAVNDAETVTEAAALADQLSATPAAAPEGKK